MSSLLAILMVLGMAGCRGQELKIREGFTAARISHDQKIGERKCRENEVPKRWNENLTFDFLTASDGSPQPTVGKKVDGKWVRHKAQIDTSKLQ
jgi:hypothetical protein